jgi:hypothetical protein
MSFKLKVSSSLPVAMLSVSLALAPCAFAKHQSSLKLPRYDKLMDGSGPATNDGRLTPSAKELAKPSSRDLSPLKLSDDNDSYSVGKDGTMKATVSESVDAESRKGSGNPGDDKSVIGSKTIGDKLLNDAKKVNIAPLALIESEGESAKKADAIVDAETAELTELWQATINRNPDIQFVINRMQPNSDPNHATATAMKMLSGALFSAIQAVPLMMPGPVNPAMFLGASGATSALSNLMAGQDQKNAKKQAISQEQATMLYKIVRETADHLVKEYRNYKKHTNTYGRALTDFQDLQAMVASTRATQDAAKQVDMEYTLRKAQRDLDAIMDDARLNRQSLVDLAGSDAVAKLDKQIADEQNLLQKLTGSDERLATPAPAEGGVEGVQHRFNMQPHPQTAADSKVTGPEKHPL